MPRKTTPNEAQAEFIRRNFETHDEHAMAAATGLDVETCRNLRNEAIVSDAKLKARAMGRLAPGVFGVDKGMSDRMDDSSKRSKPGPDPRSTCKAFPDA